MIPCSIQEVKAMIDYVRLYQDIFIDDDAFLWDKWKPKTMSDGTFLYFARIRSVYFRYYPHRGRLRMDGKILQLEVDSQVLNLDDVYEADLLQFIEDMNRHINSLFNGITLDICDFSVTRLDYCFNVYTDYVQEYLDFMYRSFRQANTGARVNYTERYKLNGSVYIKTKSDFEHNTRRRYVLNFYDKKDRLEYQRRKGIRIASEDWKYAKGVLRLEVQCGFDFIKSLLKECGMENSFGNMLSYELALHTEKKIFKQVFGFPATADFYAYQPAKKLLQRNSKAAETLCASSKGWRITSGTKYDHGRKKIIEQNICPFAFLPPNIGIDMLENPIKLIEKKLANMDIPV